MVNNPKLFLSGSRYFNNRDPHKVPVDDSTDWDFMCQFDDVITISWLKSEGFADIEVNDHYLDIMTCYVLERKDDNGKVQVSIRKNVSLVHDVFANMSVDNYCRNVWKQKCANPSGIKSYMNRKYERAIVRNYMEMMNDIVDRYHTANVGSGQPYQSDRSVISTV